MLIPNFTVVVITVLSVVNVCKEHPCNPSAASLRAKFTELELIYRSV